MNASLTASQEIYDSKFLAPGTEVDPDTLRITDLVGHSEAVDEWATLETVHQVFRNSDLRFVAVQRNGRVVGLCGRGQVTPILGTRFGFALYSQTAVSQYLLPNPMIVNEHESIYAVVNRALKREGEEFYDDIAVVDDAGRLKGLVEVARMAALQTEWVQQHARSLTATNRSLQAEIAERRQAEAVAQTAREAAEHAAQAKSDFLATMSHELRTPLNAMLGFADLLQSGRMEAEEASWCRQITSSGHLLLRLINDVLDIAKIEAGRLTISPHCVCLREVLETIFGQHQARADEKHLRFVFTVEPDVPVRVKIDALRLSQIVGNLLGNAIKFTAAGSVHLELAARSPAANHATLEIRVRDTGIGIHADHQDRIFDKFAQADSSTTRNYGGTGLGLSISRQLAELMGGEITLSSRCGEGSCFTLLLPVEVERGAPDSLVSVPKIAATLVDQSVTTPGRPPCEVLLVEDIEANQVLATLILNKLGCTVTLAQNGHEAVTLAQQRDFACILMDCQMPQMDGYAATRCIRAEALTRARRHIPIIAMTANAMAGDRELCIAAGMDDYVSKPFGVKDLIRVLDTWSRA